MNQSAYSALGAQHGQSSNRKRAISEYSIQNAWDDYHDQENEFRKGEDDCTLRMRKELMGFIKEVAALSGLDQKVYLRFLTDQFRGKSINNAAPFLKAEIDRLKGLEGQAT